MTSYSAGDNFCAYMSSSRAMQGIFDDLFMAHLASLAVSDVELRLVASMKSARSCKWCVPQILGAQQREGATK